MDSTILGSFVGELRTHANLTPLTVEVFYSEQSKEYKNF